MRMPKATDARTIRYQLPAQQEGTRVSLAKSRLGADHRGTYMGTVVQCTGSRLFIVWDDDAEFYEEWDRGDCRYWVDRGLMRFTAPPKKRRLRLPPDELVCRTCGAKGKARKKCPVEHKGPGALKPEEWATEEGGDSALTPSPRSDKMTQSTDHGGEPPAEEGNTTMTTEMISAKAAAIELGTDARTLRKFLRSDHCSFEAAGQGARYEFTSKQLKKLKKEFEGWRDKSSGKSNTDKKKTTDKLADVLAEEDIEEIDESELTTDDEAEMDLDDLVGPTDEELEELDD